MSTPWIAQANEPEDPRLYAGFLILEGRVTSSGKLFGVVCVRVPLTGSVDDVMAVYGVNANNPFTANANWFDISSGPPADWIGIENPPFTLDRPPELPDPEFWTAFFHSHREAWDEARTSYYVYISSPEVREAIAEAQRVAQQSLKSDQPRLRRIRRIRGIRRRSR